MYWLGNVIHAIYVYQQRLWQWKSYVFMKVTGTLFPENNEINDNIKLFDFLERHTSRGFMHIFDIRRLKKMYFNHNLMILFGLQDLCYK